MKVWIKLLIGTILGILLGLVLPQNNQNLMGFIIWLEQVVLQIGRYSLAPTLFFSLMIAIYQVRQDKHLWPIIGRTFIVIIISSLIILITGIVVPLLFPPARIPILAEGQKESIPFEVGQAILDIFPTNMFTALFPKGDYLLPLWVFAFFVGAGFSYDRNYTKPVIAMVDSLSRIFYYISTFFSEILGILIITIAAYWAIQFKEALQAGVYRDLILILAIYATMLCFVILPLFLYIFGPKINPWKQVYGLIGSAISAFISGDLYFSMPILIRQAKENHGIRRRVNTITLPLFTTFARAGSAMVAAISLIVIIKSYSSLGISGSEIITIFLLSFGLSFLLARHPGEGAYIGLAVICSWYGKGFEGSYLILKPIAFYLIGIGTLIDVVVASLGTFVVGKLMNMQEEREARHFI